MCYLQLLSVRKSASLKLPPPSCAHILFTMVVRSWDSQLKCTSSSWADRSHGISASALPAVTQCHHTLGASRAKCRGKPTQQSPLLLDFLGRRNRASESSRCRSPLRTKALHWLTTEKTGPAAKPEHEKNSKLRYRCKEIKNWTILEYTYLN